MGWFKGNKKILESLLTVTILISSFFLFSFPLSAGGETPPPPSLNVGLSYVAQAGLGTKDIRITTANLIRTVMGFVGIVMTLLVLLGGFIWLTAGGDAEKINKGKKFLITGLIGAIIAFSSYALAYFIIQQIIKATGAGCRTEEYTCCVNRGWKGRCTLYGTCRRQVCD